MSREMHLQDSADERATCYPNERQRNSPDDLRVRNAREIET